jgi:type I restriction enzyme S subunit
MFNSQRFQRHCKITETTVPHISIGDIKYYKILLPPLELQNRFADFVRQADKSKFELQKTVNELEATYKALLRENLG